MSRRRTLVSLIQGVGCLLLGLSELRVGATTFESVARALNERNAVIASNVAADREVYGSDLLPLEPFRFFSASGDTDGQIPVGIVPQQWGEYPRDGYYDHLFLDPETGEKGLDENNIVRVIQDMSDKLDLLKGSYVDIREGQAIKALRRKPRSFDESSMPSLGPITIENYTRKFDDLQDNICQLQIVESRHMLAGPESAQQNLQVRWLTSELGGGAFNVPPDYCEWLTEAYAGYRKALAYGGTVAPLLGGFAIEPRRGPFFVSNTALFLAEWRVVPFFGEIVTQWRYTYQTTVLRTRIWTAHPGFRGTQWFFIEPEYGDHENTRPNRSDWRLSSGRLGFQFFDKQAVSGGQDYYASRVLDHTTADLARTRCRKEEVNRRLDITPYAYFEPKFKQVLEECRGCVECAVCLEGELETENSSVQVRIGLGGATDQEAAGFLEIYSEEPSDELSTPAALMAFVDERFEVIETQGQIQQIRGPSNLVDVEVESDFRYHLRFYRKYGEQEKDSGLYPPQGEPITSITFENPGEANPLKALRISKQGEEPIRFVYRGSRSAGWDRVTGFANATRIESRKEAFSESLRTETRTFLDGGGDVIEKVVRKYQSFDWGEELIEIIEDPDGARAVTRFDFYDDRASDGPNYGRLLKREDSNGHWEWFRSYDVEGRLTQSVEQFQNHPFVLSDQWPDPLNRSVERTVEDSLETTTVFLKGKIVSREWRKWFNLGEECRIVATRPEVNDWRDPSNLVTRRLDYLVTDENTGAQAGKMARVIEPNGTMRHIRYYQEELENPFDAESEQAPSLAVERTITDVGTPDDDFQWVLDGQRTIVVRDRNGNVLSNEVYDIRTETLFSSEVTLDRDGLGRPLQTRKHDGGIEYRSYDCCGLERLEDGSGTVTEYRRDKILELDLESGDGVPELYLGTSVTRAGVTTHTLPNGRGLPWKTVIEGSDGSLIIQNEVLYDVLGRVVTEIDALGGRTTTEYGEEDGFAIITSTRPNGGQRIESLFPDGDVYEVYGSSTHGRRSVTGIEFSEDSGQWMRTETETVLGKDGSSTGRVTKTSYGISGHRLKRVFADGAEEEWRFNRKDQLIAHSDPDGVTTLFDYDVKGHQTVVAIDMNGNGQIDFDGEDRISRRLSYVENGNMHETHEVWKTEGDATPTLVEHQIASLDGRHQSDINYGLESITTIEIEPAMAARTTTVLDPELQKTVTVVQDGRVVLTTKWDSDNDLLWKQEREYDVFGRLALTRDSRTGDKNLTYYDDGRLKSELSSDPDPSLTGVGFDRQETRHEYYNIPGEGERRVTHYHDGSSRNRYFDQSGELRLQHGDNDFPVSYEYDASGQQSVLVTWKELDGTMGAGPGVRTVWEYNERGWRARKIFADGTGPSYEYTPAGRLRKRISARGIVTIYEYDGSGEVERVSYSDGTPSIHYRRDRQGRPVEIEDAAGLRVLSYSRGEVESESYGPGLFEGIRLERQRDASSRLRSLALMADSKLLQQLEIAYDAAGRTRDLSVLDQSIRYEYESSSGQIATIEYLTGQKSTLVINHLSDRLNRIQRIEAAPTEGERLALTYWYDDMDRRLKFQWGSGEQWRYRYGAFGQLVGASKLTADERPIPGYQFEFQYDGIGNRTQTSRESRTDIYDSSFLNQLGSVELAPYLHIQGEANTEASITVNQFEPTRLGQYFYQEIPATGYRTPVKIEATLEGPNGPLVAENLGYVDRASGKQVFDYDAEGNLVHDGVWQYEWNGENRLAEMKTIEGLPAELSRRLVFEYDDQGRRIRKRAFDDSEGTSPMVDIRFVYDDWNLVAEIDSNGSLIRSYVWGADIGGAHGGAGGVGGLLQMVDHRHGGAVHNYVYDGNGNVTGLVESATSEWSARYEYDPFGGLVRSSGYMADRNPFQFSSKYRDRESELIYYGFRYYAPRIGRWLSRDPIGERGGLGLYSYVGNDPTNHTDFLGLKAIEVAFGGFIPGSVGKELEHFWGAEYSNAHGYWFEEPGSIGGWLVRTDDRDFGGGTYRVSTKATVDSQDIGAMKGRYEHRFKTSSDSSMRIKRSGSDQGVIREMGLGEPTASVEIVDLGRCESRVSVSASGQYPLSWLSGTWLVPNIDYTVTFVFRSEKTSSFGSRGAVSISGTHERFPNFEARLSNQWIYRFSTADDGPGLWNLGLAGQLSFSGNREVLINY